MRAEGGDAVTQVPHRIWQRLPLGWIEFTAFGDTAPGEWLERYLASGEGWLPEEAREILARAFHAGVSLFDGAGFDSAGVSFTLGERPAVNFLCTNVVLGSAPEAVPLHRMLPVLRFGEEGTAESFTAPDGRVGTVSSGVVTEGGMTVAVVVGEIRLPEDRGTVAVMGVCTDAQQRVEIGVLTAFTLMMTQCLPEGEEPSLPEGVSEVDFDALGARLVEALSVAAEAEG